MALLSELKRRNVFRAALLYLVSAWLLAQLTYMLATAVDVAWIYRFVCTMLVICFPLALIFSYLCEITPEGLKRERDVIREQSITIQTGKKISRITKIVLAAAILLQILNWMLRY